MNAKRWFAWVCLALMLVAEFFLFRANHERDAARTDLRDAQTQLHAAQAELEELKNSSAGRQASEISGLRKQNEVLTGKVSALQKNLESVQANSQKTEQSLSKARTALELQQANLQQLQTEQQQARVAANANACINNLRLLDAAKQQWALDKNKAAEAVPTSQELLPYLKDGIFPVCPDGGVYSLNAVGEIPACSVQGHVLPQQ
jgi:chromosome segregation ATPase